ncbi:MAG: thiamine pyrophosphate-binding protein [Acidobacteriota bacterium]
MGDGLATLLVDAGVENAFGVVGGGVAPLADALNQSKIRVMHTRHESGAVFAAAEASLLSGRPAVVFATTGPGITNCMTGLYVAREEGARVILLSGVTPASRRGRWVFQDSGPHALPLDWYTPGPLFHYAAVVDHEEQLAGVARRLSKGRRRPNGFMAHLAVPTDRQSLALQRPLQWPTPLEDASRQWFDPRDVDHCASLLSSSRSMIWVGFGARDCSGLVRKLAEELGTPVMATPRAKGIFPEEHELYVGVTGLGGHELPGETVRQLKPEHTLVLGTRLAELNTGWDDALLPSQSLLHVDGDPEVPGLAFPQMVTYGIQADLEPFLEALLQSLSDRADRPSGGRPSSGRAKAPIGALGRPPRPLARSGGDVRPPFLMDAIQRILVDGSDVLLVSEPGNSVAWTNHYLRFPAAGRYRVNMGWGSMGHATTGVLGMALHGRKAVAVVGDGAMLMSCEVSTAVRYQLPVVWIVLNDSQYGMIEHGMRDAGFEPVETSIPPTDFAALAHAMGARGIRVESEGELDSALGAALESTEPIIVDVVIDPSIPAPTASRLNNLRDLGVEAAP